MDEGLFKSDIDEDDSSMFNELKDKEKVKVSITLDKKLIEELEDYKKKKDIKEFSPMLNIILKDWLKKRGKKK